MVIKQRAYEAYDVELVSRSTGLLCEDPSRAIQSQADEADINTIIRNFGVTGQLPVTQKLPMYGDFAEVGSYQDCLDVISAADAAFMQVEASVRARFNNDPHEFIAFCSDPSNLPELRTLGLAPLLPEPSPAPVEGGT